MLNSIINFYKYNKVGKIRLKVEVTKKDILSFRIDAIQMQVEWGDGQPVEKGVFTEQFTHQYTETGTYRISIQGEKITGIDMPDCQCVDLDVSQCATLEFINCSKNRLVNLDVSNCKELYELYCMENQLEVLKMERRRYPNLFYVSCSSNRLKNINLEACRKLVNLYCNRNYLKALNVRKCHKLVVINIDDNCLDSGDITDFISTLPSKLMGTSGLISISSIDQEILYKMLPDLNKKGWFEI